jgi:hypothetical protein
MLPFVRHTAMRDLSPGRIRNQQRRHGMRRMVWGAIALMWFAGGLSVFSGIQLDAAAPAPAAIEERHGDRFTVDVAMDGRTWRMNDGTNPFFPVFTGALMRGKTFIVSGRIYRGGTLAEGGEFGGTANPRGPELPHAIGTWVCRGAFNLDIAEIAAGGFPHVTSTQVFTFENRGVIVTEGPEGGARLLRSVVGGAGRYREARGDVVETPLGVNTSNLFNVRFAFNMK